MYSNSDTLHAEETLSLQCLPFSVFFFFAFLLPDRSLSSFPDLWLMIQYLLYYL